MRCIMTFVKNNVISIVLLMLMELCSCSEGGVNLKMLKISPAHESVISLSTKIYGNSELLEIEAFDGSMYELNSKYPIECMRGLENTYRVSFLGNESVVILLFDNAGNRIMGNIYDTQNYKSDFLELEKGQLLNNVMEIDPNGEYLFLYTGRNDYPRISSHYTKDGYLITIEYDENNLIKNINEELI